MFPSSSIIAPKKIIDHLRISFFTWMIISLTNKTKDFSSSNIKKHLSPGSVFVLEESPPKNQKKTCLPLPETKHNSQSPWKICLLPPPKNPIDYDRIPSSPFSGAKWLLVSWRLRCFTEVINDELRELLETDRIHQTGVYIHICIYSI